MGAERSGRAASAGAPLARYAEWYGTLSQDLRKHLAPLLFDGGVADLQAPVGHPALDAERAAELATRTDAVLADPAVRERWTGPAHTVTRSVEWMTALEQWSLLRESALAGRRIERWRVKTLSEGGSTRASD